MSFSTPQCISQIWQGLGSERPALLDQVEDVLWQVIFDAVEHPELLETLLHTALDGLVPLLDQIAPEDVARNWLRGGRRVSPCCMK
jgi:hypothetical protein